MNLQCFFKDDFLKNNASISIKSQQHSHDLFLEPKALVEVSKIEFYIEFDQEIIALRNHDYTWVKPSKRIIANDYSPKLIVLGDKTHVLSHRNIGLWEFNPKNKKQIKWVLKHTDLTPSFDYKISNARTFRSKFKLERYQLKLLFTKNQVPEFSRSRIPFSPIVCFTDHCDFDSPNRLKSQIEFFDENSIKITKGVFIYDYSKRKNNCSIEKHAELIQKCLGSQHEIAYHSLSQSVKTSNLAFEDFKNFEPITNVNTWIDHGFQPYNLTFHKSNGLTHSEWSKTMNQKHITNLWSYVDSGTAADGIINQINPNHFTAARIVNSKTSVLEKMKLLFRTILLYSGDDDIVMQYRQFSNFTKRLFRKKRVSLLRPFIANLTSLSLRVLRISFSTKRRNSPFRFSKFAPVLFEIELAESNFMVFQTVEVTDFTASFSPQNINLLLNERGLIICHTYFSSNLSHQKGRLFNDNDSITEENKKNLALLGQFIKKGEIWNPTITELVSFYKKFKQIRYEINEKNGKINVNGSDLVPIRFIAYDDL